MATNAYRNQDLSPDSLMSLIRRVRTFCEQKETEIRGQTGLSEPQYSCLRQVPPDEPVLTGDLSRRAGLSPSRGGRVVEELVQAGFLKRQPAPDDRRAQFLVLTASGKAVRRRIDRLVCRCDEILWQRLPAQDLERALDGLKVLVEVIEAE
jgi:DNA-binding MarR family transcriptional regulator